MLVLDSIIDGWLTVAIVLGAVALGLAFAWWNTRKKHFLVTLAAVALVAGVYALLVYFKETPTQQIERKIKEMAKLTSDKELDKAFKHIAEDFKIGSLNKSEFRKKAQSLISDYDISKIIVFDIEVSELNKEKGTATAFFKVKILFSHRSSLYKVS